MKPVFYALMALSLAACNAKVQQNNGQIGPEAEAPVTETDQIAVPVSDKSVVDPAGLESRIPRVSTRQDSVHGYYTGDFMPEGDQNFGSSIANKITISIDSLGSDVVFGHSVVAGNDRPFTGSVRRDADGSISGVAQEPGNAKFDGTFTFTIVPGQQKMTGTWVARNKALPAAKRTYELDKKIFRYNASDTVPDWVAGRILRELKSGDRGEMVTEGALKLNASVQKLQPSDVANMYAGDLQIIRNAIYARHGYSFRNIIMRRIFDQVEWYVPVSVDVRKDLTAIERSNIALLERYERHATRYYDYFGR